MHAHLRERNVTVIQILGIFLVPPMRQIDRTQRLQTDGH